LWHASFSLVRVFIFYRDKVVAVSLCVFVRRFTEVFKERSRENDGVCTNGIPDGTNNAEEHWICVCV
jgi:hypothetical protein